MTQKKIAVILAGCGFLDGAEINEAVLTLLSIEEEGCSYQCFAPNINQYCVINHFTQEIVNESRNVLIESARVARCNIKDLKHLDTERFDALIVVGGTGVAKNLCNFALLQDKMVVDPNVLSQCVAFKEKKLPAGYICIAPVLIGKVYQSATCTIGNDLGTAKILEKMGLRHVSCAVNQSVVDVKNKVVSTPAFMLAKNLLEVKKGVHSLVKQVIQLM